MSGARRLTSWGTSERLLPPIFAALDDGSRKFIEQSADALNDLPDQTSRQHRRRRLSAILLTILLIGWCVVAAQDLASSRLVYVVNGSNEYLLLRIDGGEKFELAALSSKRLYLPEGKHHWEILKLDNVPSEGEFEFRTGIFERFLSTPMYVLDPAMTTITVWEEAKYSAVAAETEVIHKLCLGETFYEFRDIDFPFQEFPGSIKVTGNNAIRTRVESFLHEPAQVIGFVANDLSSDEQLTFCERHLRINPLDESLIATYARFAVQASDYQRLHDFLKSGCDRRPIEIPWRRRYQAAALRVDRTDELFSEYDRLVEELPDNSAALYLRGRIEPHGPTAEDYFNQSIKADPSNPYPYYAMCHQHVSLARYDEAFEAASRAIELNPDQQDMKNILHRVRLALGQFEELEQEQRQLISDAPIEATAHFRLLGILAAQGRLAEMRQAHDEFVLAVHNEVPLDPHDLVISSERFLAYHNRDYDKMLELTLKLKNPLSRSNLMLEVLVAGGMHKELSESDLIERPPAQRGFIRLYLAMLHKLRGANESVQENFQRAIDDFRKGTPETQRIARTLTDFSDENLYENLNAVSMSATERLAVNIVLAGQTQGETRRKFLDSCRQLNFSPRFPNHTVAKLIELLDETE